MRRVALLLAACVHSAKGPRPVGDDLNLGFEHGGDGLPAGWSAGPAEGGHLVTSDAGTARSGARSVRITATPDGRYGSLSRELDAAGLVGKRVQLRGWVKSEGATGWPVTWIRVDGGQSTYVFSNSPPATSEGWTEVVADARIAHGQVVTLGVAMGGEGTAWFDDLRLDVVEPDPVVPIELTGRVLDAGGAPVADARVCRRRPTAHSPSRARPAPGACPPAPRAGRSWSGRSWRKRRSRVGPKLCPGSIENSTLAGHWTTSCRPPNTRCSASGNVIPLGERHLHGQGELLFAESHKEDWSWRQGRCDG